SAAGALTELQHQTVDSAVVSPQKSPTPDAAPAMKLIGGSPSMPAKAVEDAHSTAPASSRPQTVAPLTARSTKSEGPSTRPGASSAEVHPNGSGGTDTCSVPIQASSPQHQMAPSTRPQAIRELEASRSTRKASAVTSAVTVEPSAIPTTSPFWPDSAPSVQTALARPSESVSAATGSIDPPPSVINQVTGTPALGSPSSSVRRTTTGSFNGQPGLARDGTLPTSASPPAG